MYELIVDNFAGGGGASSGIEAAIGRSIDIAVNHDPEAIAMHQANHPNTKHYCENVWDIDPKQATQSKPVGLAWFSPDCKHFSKAKGGKPRDKKIRALAWVVIRWAAQVKPRVIFLENVEEFTTWGPLTLAGDPCPKGKGKTFLSFVGALQKLGYEVEYRELRACDFGAPTVRKRLFLIARCDGQPIVWPSPTHGKPGSKEVLSGLLKPWRTAAECIDWSLRCPSIFHRKKTLADATLRRIARGIQKYVIESKKPFIVTLNHSGESVRARATDEPMCTLTASRDDYRLTVPTMIQTSWGEREGQAPRALDIEKPLGTVMGQGVKHAVVGASLIQCGFGEAPGSPPRAIDPEKPLGSACASAVKHAIAVAHLLKHYGGNTKLSGVNLDEPVHTITAQDHHSLVAANLVRQFGTSNGASVDEPIGTVMPDGCGKTQVVVSHLENYRGQDRTASPEQPLPTVVGSGINQCEVQAFLSKYYGNCSVQSVDEPAHTLTSKDRFALVTIDSVEYVIVDIGMRMLQPHELYRAQGFPEGYIFRPNYKGKPLTKTAQIRMVGNSVCPPLAEALVRANYIEMRMEVAQ